MACPVFEQCFSWGTEHYQDCTKGILFGCSELERQYLALNAITFVDWRFTDWEHPVTRRRMAAKERVALNNGVPAVVDAYNIYDIEDLDERRKVIEAYQAWQNEQQYPTTYEQAAEHAH